MASLVKRFWGPISLERNGRKSGALGWAFLALYICLFDLYAIRTQKIETLTRSYWRNAVHPTRSVFVHIAWMIATFHLIGEHRVRRYMNK